MFIVTITKKSKSTQRKKKKSKFVQKQKQRRRVSKQTRNWLELPSDLMLNILQRVGVADRLQIAQLVCTAWREECSEDPVDRAACKEMCKLAVDRSQGQLLDLTVARFCDYELLRYVADRSSKLRRLEIVNYFGGRYGGLWSEPFKKLSLLEELSLVRIKLEVEYIEAAGRYCPLLKTLKVNRRALSLSTITDIYDDYVSISNKIALAIGKNLPELTHLELIGSGLENIGLQAILDGCCHLESLDLRRCLGLDLNGDLGKRCSQHIKSLKLPHHFVEGYLSTCYIFDGYSGDEYDENYDYDDEKPILDDFDFDTSETSYDDDVDEDVDDDFDYGDDDYDDDGGGGGGGESDLVRS
ncbi:putative F-box/LRR-repeat protein 9 [Bidens hawaiensis]|uniref:putative F-box/LRR-repeat protein 9 n=1 Tax=Bidens hawaiensis TaxID=980011 RepID=UPI00404B6AE2